MPLQNDQTTVLEELRTSGPTGFDDLRARLCWASRTRLAAALWVLQGTAEVEWITNGGGSFYRLRGDVRMPEVRVQHRHHAGRVMA
jgi:hypothetical protein